MSNLHAVGGLDESQLIGQPITQAVRLSEVFSTDGVTCGLCGLKCQNKSNLKRHMLIHSGERNFSCVICNKKFTQKSNLGRHMRTSHYDKSIPFWSIVRRKRHSRNEDNKEIINVDNQPIDNQQIDNQQIDSQPVNPQHTDNQQSGRFEVSTPNVNPRPVIPNLSPNDSQCIPITL